VTLLAENTGTARRRRSAPKARVYVLVHAAPGRSDEVLVALRDKPGVLVADVLESQSDVIMVVEAERQRLARMTIQALVSVEMLAEGVHLMPAGEHRTSMFDKESQMIAVEGGG
jgi:hypothetical protein